MVGVSCFLGPIVIEKVHSTAPGHWVRGEKTSYLRILRISENVEVWCELESVAGGLENFVVQKDFLVGLEVRGGGWDENGDTGFLVFSVRGLVGGRGLSEKQLPIFSGEFPQPLV